MLRTMAGDVVERAAIGVSRVAGRRRMCNSASLVHRAAHLSREMDTAGAWCGDGLFTMHVRQSHAASLQMV
jgi:hypothetical protein